MPRFVLDYQAIISTCSSFLSLKTLTFIAPSFTLPSISLIVAVAITTYPYLIILRLFGADRIILQIFGTGHIIL